jgi:hypothetical protein
VKRDSVVFKYLGLTTDRGLWENGDVFHMRVMQAIISGYTQRAHDMFGLVRRLEQSVSMVCI